MEGLRKGQKTGVSRYVPKTVRSASTISPSVARARTQSMIAGIRLSVPRATSCSASSRVATLVLSRRSRNSRRRAACSTSPSVASGLPVYDAGGGLRSYGLGTQARYQWNPSWASHAFAEYSRLADGVGNSPIVLQRGSPDQAMFGFGTTYSFDMPALW